jgi:hypothetical protein
MTDSDWDKISALACQILTTIYVDERGRFEQSAAQRGATPEQLAAAAITQMVRERVEGKASPPI